MTRIKYIVVCVAAALLILMGENEAMAATDASGALGELVLDGTVSEELAEEAGITVVSTDELTPATAAAISWNDNFTKKDLKYMSAIIFCEAGNLSFDAKVAVANVILNRMYDTENWGHAGTIKEVIYDRKWGVQFSPAYNSAGSMKKALNVYNNMADYKGNWRYGTMKESIEAAKAAFCGMKTVPDSYQYFNAYIEKTKAKCEAKGKSYKIIGGHIYY